MQGHIRKQGRGSWELKFDLGRDPLTGRRITKYVTFRGTKRKAQDELTRLLAHRDEGGYVDPTKMTLGEYLRHWLAADIDRRVAARTAARHREIVENNIIPRLGGVPMRKLSGVISRPSKPSYSAKGGPSAAGFRRMESPSSAASRLRPCSMSTARCPRRSAMPYGSGCCSGTRPYT